MKPTLEEMCKFIAREIALEEEPTKHLMLEALYTRLHLEQGRRQKANREKRLETLFNQINKDHRQRYKTMKLKVPTG